ncbi:MAG: CoA-binding protein [Nanoarchaeota archaeon]|nr:CoA-binding protein [Nanoarchaeota archaeon]
MEKIFNPKSVAVIGASHEKEKVGRLIYDNLIGNSKLKIYPVNVKGGKINGERVYSSVSEIEDEVDVGIIVVPAKVVPVVLEEVGEKGIKNAVIVSAGFGEVGNKKLEEELERVAEKYGIKIVGPNCMGVINPYSEMNASFFKKIPPKGKVAFLSQSGAIGSSILDKDISLSGFVSLGNMLNSGFDDWIDYFSKDDNTNTLMLYIEDVKDGEKFFESVKKCDKNIVALKSGKSLKGMEAAKSHTAALASDYNVYKGIFEQLGIVEVDNIYDLTRAARVLSIHPNLTGKKACIVGNAGGLGVLASDYAEKYKIDLPNLPEDVKKKLNEVMPKQWSKHNPIDIIGDAKAERYMKAMEVLDLNGCLQNSSKKNFGQSEFKTAPTRRDGGENSDWFDFFIIILTPQQMTQPMETAKVISKLKKPVFAVYSGGEGLGDSVDYLRKKDVVVFSELENLFRVLGRIVR